MNFLERIKNDLNDPRLNRGNNGEICRVNINALDELIHHFERLDSEARAKYESPSPREHLRNAIIAAYHASGRHPETTMITVLDTLKELAEDKHKERSRKQRLSGNL